uniref:Uncharacterized protein n=1 Tax=uncultured marine group II/III euryarchaeote KM3_07_G11 TaxID=1457840 RepID=A0A075G5K9_9EURY|nr:hypothetical protein [uncultured marine group II/III euryarchaeote KM3_07_G11]
MKTEGVVDCNSSVVHNNQITISLRIKGRSHDFLIRVSTSDVPFITVDPTRLWIVHQCMWV